MEELTKAKIVKSSAERDAVNSTPVIEWRCRHGHLLGKFYRHNEELEIKCHRCKHVEHVKLSRNEIQSR